MAKKTTKEATIRLLRRQVRDLKEQLAKTQKNLEMERQDSHVLGAHYMKARQYLKETAEFRKTFKAAQAERKQLISDRIKDLLPLVRWIFSSENQKHLERFLKSAHGYKRVSRRKSNSR